VPESPLACSVLIPLAAGEAERGALVPKKAERSCFDKECGWRNEAGPVDNRVLSEIMLCKGEGERGGGLRIRCDVKVEKKYSHQ